MNNNNNKNNKILIIIKMVMSENEADYEQNGCS